MTREDVREIGRATGAILAIQKRIHPLDFQILLSSLLANVVGDIPDDYWARMVVTKPCDVPGCDCHIVAGIVMAALDLLRNDHTKTLNDRASKN
jgi:hypothetical protein